MELVLLVGVELELLDAALDDVEFLAVLVQAYDQFLEFLAGERIPDEFVLALLEFLLDALPQEVLVVNNHHQADTSDNNYISIDCALTAILSKPPSSV